MNYSFNIGFRAFIPKSIGKPLLSYFQNHPYFPKLENRYEFEAMLRKFDRYGYHWIPEPGTSALGFFTTTDNVDLHDHGQQHSRRLGVELAIHPHKVGRYTKTDSIFIHRAHRDGSATNSTLIHAGMSHRVLAKIMPVDGREGVEFHGRIDKEIRSLRSKEHKLSYTVENGVHNTYFSKPGAKIANDGTKISFAGSAGYPFMPDVIAPNIDFEVNVRLTSVNGGVKVEIDGYHNNFPAYELIVNGQLMYLYSPAANGQMGPTPINLNTGQKFVASTVVSTGMAHGRRY